MRWANEYLTEWNRCFAWFPKNVNGTTVWLEHYEQRYVPMERLGSEQPADQPDHCAVVGRWELRTCK